MITIGLCGSTGAGKGYVCSRLAEYGIPFIDTDRLYATKTVAIGSPCLDELCMFFGKEILNGDGTLNKSVLSKKVFEGANASQHLKVLNTITHKYIKEDVLEILAENKKNGARATVIDAPVLFESGFDSICDCTICVTAPTKEKLERIIKRDNITMEKAQARLQSQLPDERLRELCDYEIVNDNEHSLDSQILEIVKKLNLDR